MIKLSIHHITLKMEQPSEKIKLEIFLETKFYFQRKLFESRTLPIKKKEKIIMVGDQVSFCMENEQQFLKFVISTFGQLENQPQNTNQFCKKYEHYSLLPDLNCPNNILTITDNSENKFDIFYQLKSKCVKTFSDEKEFAVIDKDEDKSSLIELFTVTNKFLKKITPVRRLLADVESLLAKNNMLLHFLIMLYILLIIHFGNQTIGGTLIILSFTKLKYELRFKTVEKSIGYFFREDESSEVKKNLIFINKQQIMIMNFLGLVKKLVYFKNRKLLRLLFTFGFSVLFLIVFIAFNISLKIHLTNAFLGFFLFKYNREFLPLIPYLVSILDPYLEKAKLKWEKLKLQINPIIQKVSFKKLEREIAKVSYAYEHQRFYVSVGWASCVFGGCDLKSQSSFLRQRRK